MRRSIRVLHGLVFWLVAPRVWAAAIDLSVEDFKMYRQYLNAMEDPRVQKMKPTARLPAIAKDAGFKVKDLERAIARGEAAGDLEGACQQNIQEALKTTPVANRLGKVDADLSQPHAVAYVQWANENVALLEEEASAVAAATAKACPLVSSIQVWATDAARPSARVFEGLISQSAAQNIKVERIADFADTRFIRLFEKVKNVANGDEMTPSASGGPGLAGKP